MIALDCQPFSIVEDVGFKALIKLVAPHYVLPGRKFFTSMIEKMYEEKVVELQEKLKKAEHTAITTDLWSSPAMDAIITFTCHFLDENGTYYKCKINIMLIN